MCPSSVPCFYLQKLFSPATILEDFSHPDLHNHKHIKSTRPPWVCALWLQLNAQPQYSMKISNTFSSAAHTNLHTKWQSILVPSWVKSTLTSGSNVDTFVAQLSKIILVLGWLGKLISCCSFHSSFLDSLSVMIFSTFFFFDYADEREKGAERYLEYVRIT